MFLHPHPGAGMADPPTQQPMTGHGRARITLSATGFRVNLGLTRPSGRPRWDMRMTALAPFLRASSMVGMAPLIRWLLVMTPCLSCETHTRVTVSRAPVRVEPSPFLGKRSRDQACGVCMCCRLEEMNGHVENRGSAGAGRGAIPWER